METVQPAHLTVTPTEITQNFPKGCEYEQSLVQIRTSQAEKHLKPYKAETLLLIIRNFI